MKIIKVISLFAIMSFLLLVVNAEDINSLIYQYTNPEVTVKFLKPLEISFERQQEIADEIAGVVPQGITGSNNSSPDNIICTLFGHDLAPQATVTATHHKVEKYNPRCLMELYHVTYCKRCDYTVTELQGSAYIVCCPED